MNKNSVHKPKTLGPKPMTMTVVQWTHRINVLEN